MLDKVAELKHTPSEVKSGHDESTAKGYKAEFKAHEESASSFIGRAVDETMHRAAEQLKETGHTQPHTIITRRRNDELSRNSKEYD